MMNPGRVVDILSFNIAQDFPINGTDVVVKAGNNTITREENTYILRSQGNVYGKFPIDLGYLLFSHLRGRNQHDEPIDER